MVTEMFMINCIKQHLLHDINQIAIDLAVEVREGGEKLDKLDENMHDADKNAEEAL